MAKAPRNKKITPVEQSCLELARERVRICYELYDHVAVCFSGGKDSTCVLQIALEVARELGRLPLDVIHVDEECIPPETADYVTRIMERHPAEIRMHRYCLPIEARNACSRQSPKWYPWDPEARELWVRELPPGAIIEWPAGLAKGAGLGELCAALFSPEHGTFCQLLGIRAQESMTRQAAITSKRNPERAFISEGGGDFASGGCPSHCAKAYPIYDWRTEDVWLAPEVFGWDYNRAYDLMAKAGLSISQQRCNPAFGEQPIRGLWRFKVCWPDLWAKMVDRVPGAATAARYANTELYGVGVMSQEDDPNRTWRDRFFEALMELPEESRQEIAKGLQGRVLSKHRGFTADPMPDAEPHPISGFCWKQCHIYIQNAGDKLIRQSQKIAKMARSNRIAKGVPNEPMNRRLRFKNLRRSKGNRNNG